MCSLGFLTICQIFENRTVGPIVAAAAFDQVGQRGAHRSKLRNLAIERRQVLRRERLDCRAWSVLISPKIEQVADFFNGEAQAASALDEVQGMHVDIVVGAVAISLASR